MIVDASALVLAFADPRAEKRLRGGEVAAPDLLVAETLNAFWKLARNGMPTPIRSDILGALDRIRLVPTRPLAARAAEMAEQLSHPVYDCIYVALAEAEGDELITADARLTSKLRRSSLRKRVRLLRAS